jgi:hypothetical protein
LRIGGDIFGEEFEGGEAMKASVFGFIDDAHAAATEFCGDVEVGEILTDHGRVCWVNGRKGNGRSKEATK